MPRRTRVPSSSSLPAVAAGKMPARAAGWRWTLWYRRTPSAPWTRQSSGVTRPRGGTFLIARRLVERELAWSRRDHSRWALTFAPHPTWPEPPAPDEATSAPPDTPPHA